VVDEHHGDSPVRLWNPELLSTIKIGRRTFVAASEATRTSSDGASAGLYRHRTTDYQDTARGDASRCLSWLVYQEIWSPNLSGTYVVVPADSQSLAVNKR
jgi:hypothetical protein